jgi:hypothetical protein
MDFKFKRITFLALISLFFLSCEKEITAPDASLRPYLMTLEEQTESAKQYARVQNYMNDFLTIAFSGAIAQPDFYGMSMTATQTSCPSTELLEGGELLKMQFGSAANEEGACTTLNYSQVGGTIALNKNYSSNIISTRGCQPGSLEFEKLLIQGCEIEAIQPNENENLQPAFYSWGDCPNTNNIDLASEPFVNFWFEADDKWKMGFNDSNGKSTIFEPINKSKGAFMCVQAPNLFEGELNFEDLYNASYRISLSGQDSENYNKAIFKGAGQNGEDLEMYLLTTEDLVYTPYQCNKIISGQILLMDIAGKPLMNIDYSAGAEEQDAGECDNIVKVCPCNEAGEVLTDSPDCIVTGCLP